MRILFGFILSLRTHSKDQKFKLSKIKCPEKSTYRYAFTINDRKRDEIITFGYIRYEWRECDINNHLFPPRYLIQQMLKYYLNEFVHLFDCIYEGNHWKIDVFDII